MALNSKTRLNGSDLRGMFLSSLAMLEANINEINALNVFPVPDGDTGTNMFLTLRHVVDETAEIEDVSAGVVSAAMARAALMGARGNSGVILSQFFSGIAAALDGCEDFGAKELVAAFQTAREKSYKAVGTPVEGTILTVISGISDAANEVLKSGASVTAIVEASCVAARETVARTPTMLKVLRDAGVVDAGGYGLSVILEGAAHYLKGDLLEPRTITAPDPIGITNVSGTVSMDFVDAIEEEIYGYCTQFHIQGQNLEVEFIRETMNSKAHSAVVVGDGTVVNVHVHVEDPGEILSWAVNLGRLNQVKIENMDEQHVQFAADRRQDEEVGPPIHISIVSVVLGSGIEAVFKNLGTNVVIPGGNTMNPSVQDVVTAVNATPSQNVIVLPNNRNIIPAAIQAGELADKNVHVVPTSNIPQGIAAILSFNPEQEFESNVTQMEESLETVKSAEITKAVRNSEINGVDVVQGQFIGLFERKLVTACDSLLETVISTIREAVGSEGELATLYWGDQVTKKEREKILIETNHTFPDLEVEVVDGGQPNYHVIMSIE